MFEVGDSITKNFLTFRETFGESGQRMAKWMNKEITSYWIPMVVAVLVLVVGGLALVRDGHVLNPKSTTTVTTAEVGEVAGGKKTTTVVTEEKGKETKRVTTTENQPRSPRQPEKTVTTVGSGERGLLERVLGDAGLVILQIGAVLLAAFLAAALIQRAILGQYAIKVGALELPAVAVDTTADALEALGSKIDKLDKERRDGAANVRDHLAVLYKRLDLLEKEVED